MPTPPPTTDITTDLQVEESHFESGNNGRSLVEVYKFYASQFNPDTDQPMVYAYHALPYARGQVHPLANCKYLYLTDKFVVNMNRATKQARVKCIWTDLGLPQRVSSGETPKFWLIGTKKSASTYARMTSRDAKNNIVLVKYKPGGGGGDPGAVDGSSVLGQYGRVEDLETMQTTELDMWYAGEPDAWVRDYAGRMNSAAMWGYGKWQLRLRSIASQMNYSGGLVLSDAEGNSLNGGKIMRRIRLAFEWRKRGWKEVSVYTQPQTGFPPPDVQNPAGLFYDTTTWELKDSPVTVGNGVLLVSPLLEADFTQMGLWDIATL